MSTRRKRASARPRRRPADTPTYTLLNVITASATEPTPEAKRTHQLTRMWAGLAAIETGSAPTADDWRVCSDCVNFLETMVRVLRVAQDSSGLLDDAVAALAEAAQRTQRTGQAIRLSGAGMQAVRAVLEDYAAILEALPERQALQAIRLTERRIQAIQRGQMQAHDVRVVGL